jgi:dihydrofolate reductase
MGKIIASQFITLDGVFEDPGGSEGTERGGWAFRFDRGADGDQFKLDELRLAGALLLGRATYEGFARAWPSRTDEIGYAERMNTLPKYVVSTTLERGDWNNTTVLKGNLPDGVRRLKKEVDGDILIYGSGQVVRALQEHDLIDEYRLMLYPVVLGAGNRLFGEAGRPHALCLAETRTAGECLILIYRRPRADGAPESAS